MKKYYERMKDLREDNDLRQSDMAKILGLTNQQAYQRYESGKVLIPLPLLIKIAQYFDVSLQKHCKRSAMPCA